MPPLPQRKQSTTSPPALDEDFVFPERIVLDDESFARFTHAVQNPREPNETLLAMFKKR